MLSELIKQKDKKRARKLIRGICCSIVLVFSISLSGALIPAARTLAAESPAWLDDWENRIQLTIDHEKIDASLTSFPVMVHLSSQSGINSRDVSGIFNVIDGDSNLKKIAFTTADGTTQLAAEIEEWDATNKEAWIWIKVPEISRSENTVLYLYYDADQPDNELINDAAAPGAQIVWDKSFVAVWHLNQNVDQTYDIYRDSTDRRHDGTGTNEGPNPARGLVSGGQSFDGPPGCITVEDSDDFSVTTTGQLTISLWLSPSVANFKTADDGYVNPMGKGTFGRYEWSFVFYDRDGTERPQRISFYLDNPEGGLGSGSYSQVPVELNEWVYITAKVEGGYVYLYRNGVLAHKDPYTGPDAYVEIEPQNGTEPVRIGTRNLKTWFEGRIDEVRISNVSLSDAWIKASYYSDIDSLLSYGLTQSGKPVLQPTGDRTVVTGQRLFITIKAASPFGEELEVLVNNLPDGAIFDRQTHTIIWEPLLDQVGTYANVQIRAVFGRLSTSENITLNVVAPVLKANTSIWARSDPSLAIIGGLILTAAAMTLMLFLFIRAQHKERRT